MIQDKTEVYFMKCFNRLRNKAQIFSSLADDHYHTRLIHSLEVESIAIEIFEQLKLKKNSSFSKINVKKLSTIALLHDIGHTPFGHIGERTLHELCSGNIIVNETVNFKKTKVACGFKHNINSAILFKEYLLKQGRGIDDFDVDVLDGIIKHTSIFYDHQNKLDYGFEYVNAGLPRAISYNNNPCSFEGLIVAFADEIAQICSDYCDLSLSGANISDLKKSKPFSNSNSEDLCKFVLQTRDHLIDLLVNSIDSKSTYKSIASGTFGFEINDFNEKRKKLIKSDLLIKSHDSIKEKYIIELFKYYFINGFERREIMLDYFNRINRMKLNINVLYEVKGLKLDDIKDYFNNVVSCNVSKRLSVNFSKKKRASYRLLYKMYIRTIAIHISKMTDSYANHKIEKIMSARGTF